MIGMPKMADKMYPMTSFDFTTLPEAKDWKVGQTYTVTLKLKQTGINVYKDGKGSAQFDIIGVEVGKDKKEPKKINGKQVLAAGRGRYSAK